MHGPHQHVPWKMLQSVEFLLSVWTMTVNNVHLSALTFSVHYCSGTSNVWSMECSHHTCHAQGTNKHFTLQWLHVAMCINYTPPTQPPVSTLSVHIMPWPLVEGHTLSTVHDHNLHNRHTMLCPRVRVHTSWQMLTSACLWSSSLTTATCPCREAK